MPPAAAPTPACPGRRALPWPTRPARTCTSTSPRTLPTTYITDLADLFAYGSNGVNPYTSPQASPVWAPLNSNLKVYIEFSNEIWNWGFTQAGTGGAAG